MAVKIYLVCLMALFISCKQKQSGGQVSDTGATDPTAANPQDPPEVTAIKACFQNDATFKKVTDSGTDVFVISPQYLHQFYGSIPGDLQAKAHQYLVVTFVPAIEQYQIAAVNACPRPPSQADSDNLKNINDEFNKAWELQTATAPDITADNYYSSVLTDQQLAASLQQAANPQQVADDPPPADEPGTDN